MTAASPVRTCPKRWEHVPALQILSTHQWNFGPPSCHLWPGWSHPFAESGSESPPRESEPPSLREWPGEPFWLPWAINTGARISWRDPVQSSTLTCLVATSNTTFQTTLPHSFPDRSDSETHPLRAPLLEAASALQATPSLGTAQVR